MNKILTKKFILLLVCGILFPSIVMYSQFEGKSIQEIKNSALTEFQEGKYSAALEKYEFLLKKYPRDGLFQYYSGCCLFFVNKSIPSAIQYLKYSSTRPNVPPDAYFYLGECYMLNYQFSEAGKAYYQFYETGAKTEIKEKQPLRKAEMAENAIKLTKQKNIIEIINSSLFSFKDSNHIKQIKAMGGELGNKPEELKTPFEDQGDLCGLSFMPQKIFKGDYIYFSGYGKNKKRGTELFRVKSLGEKKWADPEPLESLNTDYNEIIPYYDPAGKDLYFASEGHSSMGGLDIFKSHYNQENNTWTEPVNLGFPVNSTSNEYIFLPGTDLGTVLILTDRQGLDEMSTIYILRVKEPKLPILRADNESLKTIGNLGGIESIPNIIDIAEKSKQTEQTITVKNEVPIAAVVKENLLSKEYDDNVKKALRYQFMSDSLARLAREARMEVKAIPDPNHRWTIQSKIIVWEKQSSEYQSLADECYLILKKFESDRLVSKKDSPENRITDFRFNTPNELSKTNDSSSAVMKAGNQLTEKKLIVTPVLKNDDNQFIILDKSPYSDNNPVPTDIIIPSGCFYRIQLGAFGQQIDWNTFIGISPLTTESIPNKPLKRYYAGKFTKLENAKAALNIVKNSGFKDSFIAAWYNGQKLAVEKVLDYEKRDLNNK